MAKYSTAILGSGFSSMRLSTCTEVKHGSFCRWKNTIVHNSIVSFENMKMQLRCFLELFKIEFMSPSAPRSLPPAAGIVCDPATLCIMAPWDQCVVMCVLHAYTNWLNGRLITGGDWGARYAMALEQSVQRTFPTEIEHFSEGCNSNPMIQKSLKLLCRILVIMLNIFYYETDTHKLRLGLRILKIGQLSA